MRAVCGSTHRPLQHAVLSKDVSTERLAAFITLLVGENQDVVIDVPHAIDNLTATAFGMATDIHLVVQQSTSHLRNATRLIRIVRDELGVSRHNACGWWSTATTRTRCCNSTISRARSVSMYRPRCRATISARSRARMRRTPMYEADRGAAITASLLQIVAGMTGSKAPRRGLLQRALPSFLRS